jgi:phosphate/sulfate permease
MSGTLNEYLWIAIAGGIFGFIYNFSIGANDVANAFVSCSYIHPQQDTLSFSHFYTFIMTSLFSRSNIHA